MNRVDVSKYIDYLKDNKLVVTRHFQHYTVSLEKRVFVAKILQDEAVPKQLTAFVDIKEMHLSNLPKIFSLDDLRTFTDSIEAWGFKGMQVAVIESGEQRGHYDIYVVPGPRVAMDFVKFNAENKRNM